MPPKKSVRRSNNAFGEPSTKRSSVQITDHFEVAVGDATGSEDRVMMDLDDDGIKRNGVNSNGMPGYGMAVGETDSKPLRKQCQTLLPSGDEVLRQLTSAQPETPRTSTDTPVPTEKHSAPDTTCSDSPLEAATEDLCIPDEIVLNTYISSPVAVDSSRLTRNALQATHDSFMFSATSTRDYIMRALGSQLSSCVVFADNGPIPEGATRVLENQIGDARTLLKEIRAVVNHNTLPRDIIKTTADQSRLLTKQEALQVHECSNLISCEPPPPLEILTRKKPKVTGAGRGSQTGRGSNTTRGYRRRDQASDMPYANDKGRTSTGTNGKRGRPPAVAKVPQLCPQWDSNSCSWTVAWTVSGVYKVHGFYADVRLCFRFDSLSAHRYNRPEQEKGRSRQVLQGHGKHH